MVLIDDSAENPLVPIGLRDTYARVEVRVMSFFLCHFVANPTFSVHKSPQQRFCRLFSSPVVDAVKNTFMHVRCASCVCLLTV